VGQAVPPAKDFFIQGTGDPPSHVHSDVDPAAFEYAYQSRLPTNKFASGQQLKPG
jgi:hypothetical protein